MLMMKWRIAERKLQFTNKLRTKDDNNIAKRTLNNEVILGLKGLKSECSQITKEAELPNGRILDLADQEINKKTPEERRTQRR